MSDHVYWILQLELSSEKQDAAHALMQEMIESTTDEPGALNYEWAFNEDGTECHIYERYKDSAATLVHLGNFGAKFAERFMGIFSVKRITIYGNPSAEVRAGMAGLGPAYYAVSAGFAR